MTPRISGLILVMIVVMKVTILCLMSSGCTFGGPSGTGFEDLGSGYPFLRTLAPRISTFEGFYRLSLAGWLAGWLLHLGILGPPGLHLSRFISQNSESTQNGPRIRSGFGTLILIL